jgi:hypothetical protein
MPKEQCHGKMDAMGKWISWIPWEKGFHGEMDSMGKWIA